MGFWKGQVKYAGAVMAVFLTAWCRWNVGLGHGQQADTRLATAGLSRAPGGGTYSWAPGISPGTAPPRECHWLPGPQELDQGEGRILTASTLPATKRHGWLLRLLPALGPSEAFRPVWLVNFFLRLFLLAIGSTLWGPGVLSPLPKQLEVSWTTCSSLILPLIVTKS